MSAYIMWRNVCGLCGNIYSSLINCSPTSPGNRCTPCMTSYPSNSYPTAPAVIAPTATTCHNCSAIITSSNQAYGFLKRLCANCWAQIGVGGGGGWGAFNDDEADNEYIVCGKCHGAGTITSGTVFDILTQDYQPYRYQCYKCRGRGTL